jgi:tetratricopeptide (TPR) repeat protein
LKKDKWSDSEVSAYMGGVTSDLATATREWEELNDILQEGDSLIASMSANQQLLTNSMNEKEALEFYTKWLADVEKATNASTSFSEAIGKSGSMSAEALAELAKYDAEVVKLYNTMSSSEWNKYAYTKALEYYDSLLELYDEDSAEYAAALQAKKTAS